MIPAFQVHVSDEFTPLSSEPTSLCFLTRFYDPWIEVLIKLKQSFSYSKVT